MTADTLSKLLMIFMVILFPWHLLVIFLENEYDVSSAEVLSTIGIILKLNFA